MMNWRRKWQPTPVFLPGESQGRGSLVACRLWGSHRVGRDWSDWAGQEKVMALHSSTLAWKIPWMEEPSRLQSMESLRVGHDWSTSLSLLTFMHSEGNGNPLQCSCLETPREGGAWWPAVYGVAQSRTWLKWLSSLANPSKCWFCSITISILKYSKIMSGTK